MGVTTLPSVVNSVDQLAAARRMVLTQEFGMAAQLLGANERLEAGSGVSVFGAGGTGGSADGGAAFRAAFASDFSLLGGVGVANEAYANVRTGNTVMVALALRYVHDDGGDWRPYVEIGAWGVPSATFSFSRSYLNGAGVAVGSASASADKFYVYGRAGAAYSPQPGLEAAASVEIGHAELYTGSFAEALSSANPFEASGGAANDRLTVAKIRAQLTQAITSKLDLTVWAAGAFGFDGSTGLVADVDGFGPIRPNAAGHPTWAEYGGRLGLQIAPHTALSAFFDGVSGGDGIGTDVRVGGALSFSFK